MQTTQRLYRVHSKRAAYRQIRRHIVFISLHVNCSVMTHLYINLKIYQGKTFNHIANDVGSLYFVQITRVIVEWLAAGQISKYRI